MSDNKSANDNGQKSSQGGQLSDQGGQGYSDFSESGGQTTNVQSRPPASDAKEK